MTAVAGSPADLAPGAITALFVLLVTVMGVLVVAGVGAATRAAGWSGRAALVTALALGGWLAGTVALAAAGFFANFGALPPRLGLLLVVVVALLVTLARSRGLAPLLAATPEAWLVYAQAFRIAVELILWRLVAAGAAPELMSFTGRNFDVAVGLTAPVIAYACFTARRWPRRVALWWNVAGFAVLAHTVFSALLAAPTPLQVFRTTPPLTFVATVPYIWLPAFLVALAWCLHVRSIRQLLAPAPRPVVAGSRRRRG